MRKEEYLQKLRDWRERMPNKWGIFVDGKQVFISSSNVYASRGMARRKLEETYFGTGTKISDADLDALLESGEIEIKEIK